VDPGSIRYVGQGLQRPECILAERDGTLWSADARGGVMRIAPDGTQSLISQRADRRFDLSADASGSLQSGTLPNGLALAKNGDFIIANFGTDRLELMSRDGTSRVLLDKIDGKPLGKVNFVLRDRQDRLWVTISTRINPWSDAVTPALADGYICLVDGKGARVVAEGFHFTNEIRLDAREEWLYVAESCGRRVTRLRVGADGTLSQRQTHGPSDLGPGLIDGFAFDAYGNLWATMIFADRLIAITPEGAVLELLDDGDKGALQEFEASFASGTPVSFDALMKCGGSICPWLASVTFGGDDLRTVYLGGLRSTRIPYFRSPVAGLPMVHW
jgi:gluconolactonase